MFIGILQNGIKFMEDSIKMVKTKFNTSWKASKQPRKQRKYRYNAPLHVLRKFMASMLDKPLREKHGMRNIEVRKGDEVLVMRGKFKKKRGKVNGIDLSRTRINIDGINRTKKDGGKVNVWFNPSNVKIMVLNLDDVRRMKKGKVEEKPEEEKKKEEKKPEEKKNETKSGEKKNDTP